MLRNVHKSISALKSQAGYTRIKFLMVSPSLSICLHSDLGNNYAMMF